MKTRNKLYRIMALRIPANSIPVTKIYTTTANNGKVIKTATGTAEWGTDATGA